MEKEKTERRGFFKKITAAVLGATLLGSLNIKPASAACGDYVRMCYSTTGTGQTTLTSSTQFNTLTCVNTNTSGNAIKGVAGSGTISTGTGVVGMSDALGRGVSGHVGAEISLPAGVGVGGTSAGGYGVYGKSTSGYGVLGLSSTNHGVYGSTTSGRGVYGVTNTGTGGVYGQCLSGSGIPMIARGASTQTNDLQRWYKGSSIKARFNQDGWLGIGVDPERSVHLQGSNACFRMDRNVNSAAFILVRTASGDFNTIWKTFYVGVDASGVNNGEFFIGDVGTNVSGASTIRLRIKNNGNVWVKVLETGDIKLANDFIVTEDEKAGVAFKNPKGEKIAVLDRQGNLQVKGKITENPNL